MAVATVEKVGLKLDLDAGMENGKQKIASRSYTNFKHDADDSGIFIVANVLSGMCTMGLIAVRKTVVSLLTADQEEPEPEPEV